MRCRSRCPEHCQFHPPAKKNWHFQYLDLLQKIIIRCLDGSSDGKKITLKRTREYFFRRDVGNWPPFDCRACHRNPRSKHLRGPGSRTCPPHDSRTAEGTCQIPGASSEELKEVRDLMKFDELLLPRQNSEKTDRPPHHPKEQLGSLGKRLFEKGFFFRLK